MNKLENLRCHYSTLITLPTMVGTQQFIKAFLAEVMPFSRNVLDRDYKYKHLGFASLPPSHRTWIQLVHTNQVYVMFIFSTSHRNTQHSIWWQELKTMDILYLSACIVLQIYCLFIHDIVGILVHLEFLTLLLTSFTSALGVVWTWLQSYSLYLFN